MSSFPFRRMRRLRQSSAMRELLAETRVSRHGLVQPLFICDGEGIERPIESLPGQAQISSDRIGERAKQIQDAGVPAVILFGVPDKKDAEGSESVDPDGVVPRADRAPASESREPPRPSTNRFLLIPMDSTGIHWDPKS